MSTRYPAIGPDEMATGVELEHSGRTLRLSITIPVDRVASPVHILVAPVSQETGEVRLVALFDVAVAEQIAYDLLRWATAVRYSDPAGG